MDANDRPPLGGPVNNIERAFFHDWKGRGNIILRKDKDQLKKELDRFVAAITVYNDALKARFEKSKKEFRDRLVGGFLRVWQKSPPDRLSRRGLPTEYLCKADISYEADGMFDRAIKLGMTDAKVIYKDIAIEDLKDEVLMMSLRKVMERAGVDRNTVEKLFQSGDAAAAQGSSNHI